MRVSFEGIGECVATFCNSATAPVKAGQAVKLGGNATVAACADGELVFGVAVTAGTDFAAVQTAGFVTLPYSGETAPTVGYSVLAADGAGGMKVAETGREYAILQVDTAAKTLGLML